MSNYYNPCMIPAAYHFIIITSLLVIICCKRGHHYSHFTEENTEVRNGLKKKNARAFEYMLTTEGRELVFVSIVPTRSSIFNNCQFGYTSYSLKSHFFCYLLLQIRTLKLGQQVY